MSSLKVVFIFIFILTAPVVYSQNSEIDSLILELKGHPTKDTIRVGILYDLAFTTFYKDEALTNTYLEEAETISTNLSFNKGLAGINYMRGILASRKSNFKESNTYFKEALTLFESIEDRKGVASINNGLGINFYKQGEHKEALYYFNKSIKFYDSIEDTHNLIAGLLNTGNIYAETGKYENAIGNYDRVIKLSKEVNHPFGVPYALNSLGNIYESVGNYPQAIDHFNQSLYYKEEAKDTLAIAITLNSLGRTYVQTENFEKAKLQHEKSLKLATQIGNKGLIATNKANLGNINLQLNKPQEAKEQFEEALALSQSINDKVQIAICLNKLGNVHLKLSKLSEAKQFFLETIEICLETDDKEQLSKTYFGLAEVYFKENNYPATRKYAHLGLDIAKDLGLLAVQRNALELLSKVYDKTGQYKKAFETHQEYKKLNDSLFNKESIEKMTQLEYEYKYKQALDSASIRELKLTKTVLSTSEDLEKSKRNYLWAIIGVLLISIVSGTAIFYQKLNNAKAVTQNAIVEQKLLRSQMTPHFIFNSLAVLQGMILNKEEGKSVSYLSKFSKLLRLTLENSRDKMVFLSKELEALENYIQLQNLESDTLRFSIDMADTVDPSALKIPPMLIQPFVENAVEHAFRNQSDNKEIKLELSFQDAALKCVILDNGVGIDATSQARSPHKTSLSTLINRERLQFLSKDFKTKGSITIEDRKKYGDQGTMVTMIIPYQNTTIT